MHVAVNDARQNSQSGDIDTLRIFGRHGGHGSGRPGGDDAASVISDEDAVSHGLRRTSIEQPRTDKDRGTDEHANETSSVKVGRRSDLDRTRAGGEAAHPTASIRPEAAVH